MKSLFDAFEAYLQGLVNTSITGVLSRLDRLEEAKAAEGVTMKQVEDKIDIALEDFDYVKEDEVDSKIKEAIERLTFEVTVR